jgi:hypothetical protein
MERDAAKCRAPTPSCGRCKQSALSFHSCRPSTLLFLLVTFRQIRSRACDCEDDVDDDREDEADRDDPERRHHRPSAWDVVVQRDQCRVTWHTARVQLSRSRVSCLFGCAP